MTVTRAWDPTKHKRDPGGEGGGQFVRKIVPGVKTVKLPAPVTLFHVTVTDKTNAIESEGLRPASEVGVSELLAGTVENYDVDGVFLANASQADVLRAQLEDAGAAPVVFRVDLEAGQQVAEDELMPEGSLIAVGSVPAAAVELISEEELQRRRERDVDVPALFERRMAWNPSAHPRDPGGEGGGRFIRKGATAPGVDLTPEQVARLPEADRMALRDAMKIRDDPSWAKKIIDRDAGAFEKRISGMSADEAQAELDAEIERTSQRWKEIGNQAAHWRELRQAWIEDTIENLRTAIRALIDAFKRATGREPSGQDYERAAVRRLREQLAAGETRRMGWTVTESRKHPRGTKGRFRSTPDAPGRPLPAPRIGLMSPLPASERDRRKAGRHLFPGERPGERVAWNKRSPDEPVEDMRAAIDTMVARNRLKTVRVDNEVIQKVRSMGLDRGGHAQKSEASERVLGDAPDTLEMHKRGATKDGRPVFTEERAELHAAIIERHLAGHESQPEGERRVLFTAGGTAVGKSSSLRQYEGPPDAVTIDPDALKKELPEYAELVQDGDPFASGAAHEEASYLSKEMQSEAMRRGINVVMDTTGDGGERGKFTRKLRAAAEQGYGVEVVATHASLDEAVERMMARGDRSGRYVQVPEMVENHRGVVLQHEDWRELDFVSWQLYSTSGKAPGEADLVAEGRGGRSTVHMTQTYSDFLTKAHLPEKPKLKPREDVGIVRVANRPSAKTYRVNLGRGLAGQLASALADARDPSGAEASEFEMRVGEASMGDGKVSGATLANLKEALTALEDMEDRYGRGTIPAVDLDRLRNLIARLEGSPSRLRGSPRRTPNRAPKLTGNWTDREERSRRSAAHGRSAADQSRIGRIRAELKTPGISEAHKDALKAELARLRRRIQGRSLHWTA